MTAAWKWMQLPDWLKAWPYRQPSDFVCSPASDPDRPDPVALERERLERQKERETPAGQSRERDFAERQAQRQSDLTREGSWVSPSEVLQRFPKVAERFAQGMPEPNLTAFGPRDEMIKEQMWLAAALRMRDAQLARDGIVAPVLDWSHERSEVPR